MALFLVALANVKLVHLLTPAQLFRLQHLSFSSGTISRASLPTSSTASHVVNVVCFILEKLEKLDQEITKLPSEADLESQWKNLEAIIHQSALDTYGRKERNNPDWYNASLQEMTPVIEEKRKALLKDKSRPTRQSKEDLRAARANVQRTARQCARDYWESLCDRIEKARDSGNVKEMYSAINIATGPSPQACSVLKRRNGSMIVDKA